MDKNAQVHILEVVIVAGLLLASLYFVKSFDFSPPSVINKETKLETLAEGILANLEAISDPSDEYNNLLARYTNYTDTANFKAYIENNLPKGSTYDVLRINVSNMHKELGATVESSSGYIIWSRSKIGSESYASRIVVINGYVYKVVLGIYYTLR